MKVPQPTIERLVNYYRVLRKLAASSKEEIIPSSELGRCVGVSAAQVRKDLSYFGGFGCKGVGYNIKGLKLCLERILGFNKNWSVILVGAGNLGRALVNYQGFKKMGFSIVDIFDCDLGKIGHQVGGLTVKSCKEIAGVVAEERIDIAIITVPAEDAQQVADQLMAVGIKAIWNFAPVMLTTPDHVITYCEDIACSLVNLAYQLNNPDEGLEESLQS